MKITKSQFQHLLKNNDSRREQGPRSSSYFCDVEINNNGSTRHYLGVLHGNIMSEGRTHRGPSDIAPARKRRRRANEGQGVAIMGALTAVYEPRHLGWDVTIAPESFLLPCKCYAPVIRSCLYPPSLTVSHLSLIHI